MKRISYIIGIDEVGRGALAGPVTVAAVALRRGTRLNPKKDSKQLSIKQREKWLVKIKEYERTGKLVQCLVHIPHTIIDKRNIVNATNQGVSAVLKKMRCRLNGTIRRVYLDGGMEVKNPERCGVKARHIKMVPRGDTIIPAIMLASIVAKVNRDWLMQRLHKKYPAYRLNEHVGYGTKLHRYAVRAFGRSPIHRVSFRIRIKDWTLE